MQGCLLDTHAFLWFVFDDPRLSPRAVKAISEAGTAIRLSAASLWEITIKQQIGKLRLGMPLDDFLRDFVEKRELEVLPLQLDHLRVYDTLALFHRDPFDRLLIAQAQASGLPLISADPQMRLYDLSIIW